MPVPHLPAYSTKVILPALALGLMSLVAAEQEPPSGTKAPNLIFVFPDQMRGSAMGFLGEEPVKTPNLDQFARESLVLTQAVSNYPVSSPYRAMMLTGMYPHKNNVMHNVSSSTAHMENELPTDARCWSDVLNDLGYSLGYIGKWHLDLPHKPYISTSNNTEQKAWNEWTPPERRHGFDFWHSYGTYDQHMNPMYWRTGTERDDFMWANEWGPQHETDVAVQYIRNDGKAFRDPENPFALVVSMNPPHSVYTEHPDDLLKAYDNIPEDELFSRPNIPAPDTKLGRHYRKYIRHYYAMISGVDEQFGRIVDAVEEAGIAENTIIVFTSDHGDCLGAHGAISKNVPYEESMRIPFLIRWKGTIEPREDSLLLSVPDLYPTLLDLMGHAEHIPDEVQGTSYATVFLTGDGERPSSQLYMQYGWNDSRYGKRGVRNQRYTMMIETEGNKEPLYYLWDRVEDPFQLKNIAGERADVITELREELERKLIEVEDPWQMPNP